MQRSQWLCTVAVAVVVLACAAWEARAAVISIDLGGEWIKVALVKPGVPMEIVLNKESKRKTAAVVSMRNDERLFGEAALSTGVKYPKNAYRYLQLLLGQKYDSPLVAKYRQWFPFYDMKKDEEGGTILFEHDSETVFTPEELVAMILNYTRILAQDYAEQPIRECVITVPVFFTQAQRRAMLYAANLVGLNVLQLMTNAAATALNYGLFRQSSFNTTAQYVMFYDVGALSTTASIIEYRKAQVKEGSVTNTYPQLAVKGVGYDRLLGGLEIDIRLRDHLAKNFESLKKTQGSVYESPRAMAKLLKEAKRVKQVLSANIDHFAQVEGLLEDVDFRLRVTREELETMCSDLYDRVGEPVRQALEAADMTMVEIDSVILMGGGTRIPRIQEALLSAVSKSDLGKSLNTDEAAALGAVYQAAGQTKLFRVKKFIVKDANVFPIMVSFEKHVSVGVGEEGEEEEEVVKVVKKTLFQRGNSYPQKKVLTFNRYSNDFPFSVYYSHLGFLSEEERIYVGRANLTEVYLVGVGDALSAHSAAEAKGIKAHFRMDESGLLLLDNVESLFEYPPEKEEQSTLSKIGSTLSSLFGGGSSEAESEGEKMEQERGGDGGEEGQEEEGVEKTEAEETEEEGEGEGEKDGGEVEGDESEPEIEEEEVESVEEEEAPPPETEEETPTTEDGDEVIPTEEEPLSSDDNEEEVPPVDDTLPTEEEAPSSQEEQDETAESDAPESNATTSDSEESKKEEKGEKKEKAPPTGRAVKVNITAEITVLDLTPPSAANVDISTEKLRALQDRDDEKVANEKAKNNLESYIFETQSWLEVTEVVAMSTEEQRETIRVAVREVYGWFEEEGYYNAETKVYKEKLRELKRPCRSLLKRVGEAEKRPKLINQLMEAINISFNFATKMRNVTEDMQIFTEVEITSLETLTNESMEWLQSSLAELKATPPHEDPPVLSFQFEEQQLKLDREIMYLLNKIKTRPPPKPKTPANTTDTSTDPPQEEGGGGEESVSDESGRDEGEGEKEEEEEEEEEGAPATGEERDEVSEVEEEEEAAEPLALHDDAAPTEDADSLPTSALPTSSTPRGEL